MIDIILETVIDALKMTPILYLAYLLMEYLELKAGEKLNRTVAKVGYAGPAIGSLIGAIPQCGFSGAVAGFFSAHIVTLGTMLAVFLSTSDEMLPILLSSDVEPKVIFKILLFKILGAAIFGFIVDITFRVLKKSRVTSGDHIHDFCEQEQCDCHENIFLSALKHTIKVLILIIIVSFALNCIFEFFGNDFFSGVFMTTPFVAEIISGLVGLIPNCSVSVLITNLFVEDAITPGAMLSGLMTNAGVGLLVLFRLNKNLKENIFITTILLLGGVILGFICGQLWYIF
ncbi:MAG: arsenic efflux protein [Ruminococcus sp.]|nr:arsenic efflux protein [Ruminococcus sp.]